MLTIDTLAQEIRRVDGNHSLGAGALAEALMPFISAALSIEQTEPDASEWHRTDRPGGASVLLYTLREEVWRRGEPVLVNDVTINIDRAHSSETDIEPIVQRVRSALVNTQADADVVERLKEALKGAAEELDRISCVPRVTETSDIYDQFERAKFFADRGASAAWATVRSRRPAEVGSATTSIGSGTDVTNHGSKRDLHPEYVTAGAGTDHGEKSDLHPGYVPLGGDE